MNKKHINLTELILLEEAQCTVNVSDFYHEASLIFSPREFANICLDMNIEQKNTEDVVGLLIFPKQSEDYSKKEKYVVEVLNPHEIISKFLPY